MRIVFFGTSDFAARILESLVSNQTNIVAIVTQPDRPRGRSGKPQAPPVKETALSICPNAPLHQPEKASTEEFASTLAEYRADLFVVVAYGEIIKQNLLDMPALGCINIHPSLLPKYRGAAPIQRAIMDGVQETGVTIMYMVRKMDAGDIIAQETLSLGPNETFRELDDRLCQLSQKMLEKVLSDFASENVARVPQDHDAATYAAKILPEDLEVDWSKDAFVVHNMIRAVTPRPGAWCLCEQKGKQRRLKVLRSEVLDLPGEPGKILSYGKDGIVVACGKGALKLLEVQPEGKRAMDVASFVLGQSQEELVFFSHTSNQT